jgi:hypothetical protein
MTVYMVERDLKGISMEALGGAQKAAVSKAAEMTSKGTDISYQLSTLDLRTGGRALHVPV